MMFVFKEFMIQQKEDNQVFTVAYGELFKGMQ